MMTCGIGKKRLIPLLLSLAVSQSVYADIATFDITLDIWNISLDGELGIDDTPATWRELGIDSDTTNNIELAFEHAIPMLPHLQLSYVNASSEGIARDSREMQIIDITVPENADVTTELTLQFIDYGMYWTVLDTVVESDIGITARQFNSDVSVNYSLEADAENEAATGSEEQTFDDLVAMLYARLAIDLPFTGWYLGSTLHYSDLSDTAVKDLSVEVGFLTDNLGLDIGMAIGYRTFELTLEEQDSLKTDLRADGLFVNIILHF